MRSGQLGMGKACGKPYSTTGLTRKGVQRLPKAAEAEKDLDVTARAVTEIQAALVVGARTDAGDDGGRHGLQLGKAPTA